MSNNIGPVQGYRTKKHDKPFKKSYLSSKGKVSKKFRKKSGLY